MQDGFKHRDGHRFSHEQNRIFENETKFFVKDGIVQTNLKTRKFFFRTNELFFKTIVFFTKRTIFGMNLKKTIVFIKRTILLNDRLVRKRMK